MKDLAMCFDCSLECVAGDIINDTNTMEFSKPENQYIRIYIVQVP